MQPVCISVETNDISVHRAEEPVALLTVSCTGPTDCLL